MSAATLDRPVTDISTEFLWSEEDITLIGAATDDVCERVYPPCDRRADVKVWYQANDEVPGRSCTCGVHTRLLCDGCFEKLTSKGLVICAKCSDTTGQERFKKIVYSERIR